MSISKGIFSLSIILLCSGPSCPDIPFVIKGVAIVPDIASKSCSISPIFNLLIFTRAFVSDSPIDRAACTSLSSGKSLDEKYPVNFIFAL